MNKLIKEIPRASLIILVIYFFLAIIDYLKNAPNLTTAYESGYYVGHFMGIHFFNFIFYSLTLYFVNAALYLKLDDFLELKIILQKELLLDLLFHFL